MRIAQSLAALLALGLFVSAARAGSVEYQFNSVTNGGIAITPLMSGNAMSGAGIIGQYNWTIIGPSTLGPVGMNFSTFCIDITQDISFHGQYDYSLIDPADAPKPASTYMNGPMGSDNAAALGRLWAADIGNVLNPSNTVSQELENAAAFQLAVWKITYNATPGNNINTFDALDDLTVLTSDSTVEGFINNNAKTWASAALGSSGTGTPLIALSSDTYQDQITAAPTPVAAIAGFVLMAAAFAFRLRKRHLMA